MMYRKNICCSAKKYKREQLLKQFTFESIHQELEEHVNHEQILLKVVQ